MTDQNYFSLSADPIIGNYALISYEEPTLVFANNHFKGIWRDVLINSISKAVDLAGFDGADYWAHSYLSNVIEKVPAKNLKTDVPANMVAASWGPFQARGEAHRPTVFLNLVGKTCGLQDQVAEKAAGFAQHVVTAPEHPSYFWTNQARKQRLIDAVTQVCLLAGIKRK
jgi:hypothetical protein